MRENRKMWTKERKRRKLCAHNGKCQLKSSTSKALINTYNFYHWKGTWARVKATHNINDTVWTVHSVRFVCTFKVIVTFYSKPIWHTTKIEWQRLYLMKSEQCQHQQQPEHPTSTIAAATKTKKILSTCEATMLKSEKLESETSNAAHKIKRKCLDVWRLPLKIYMYKKATITHTLIYKLYIHTIFFFWIHPDFWSASTFLFDFSHFQTN